MKTFPLRSGTRQGCPLLPFLFIIVLEVLVIAISQEKEVKASKSIVKLTLFADDIILLTENPTDFTKRLLELMNEFSKAAG